MKSSIILLILIGGIFSNFTNAKQSTRNYSLVNVPYSIKKDIECLHTSYDKIVFNEGNKTQNEKQFIECFPKTFDRFVLLFGYYYDLLSKIEHSFNNYYDRPLISRDTEIHESTSYTKLFIELTTVKEDYLTMFSLTINGYYQTDAVSYYYLLLSRFIKKNPKITAETLDQMSSRDLDSFWHFYFDGWTYNEPFPKELLAIQKYSEHVFNSAQRMFKLYKKNYVHD